ncbi:MAG: sulfite exporter TauE/SafE family protein [Thermoplasmata archaeon]|nr:sulfite exporter TauE/SafE family protein [Thermoplasmata archaeon]
METWILLLAIVMLFFAGMMQGLLGFGFSMVSIPILIMCINSQLLIPIVIVHSLVINAFLFYKVRKYAELKRIRPLIATAIIGIPIGTYLLLVIDPQIFRVFIGVFIVFFGIAYLKDYRKELKNEKMTFIPVGLISGILNGSITLSGPPVIFCFTNQGVRKKIFRANMIAYFFLLNLATIPFFLIGGLLTPEVIKFSALLLPGMMIGAFSGACLVKRVNERAFRKIAMVVVTVSGMISIITGLGLI